MAYCGWARQGELPVRPGRVLESEEPVHPPAAIRLPQQEGDVPPELRPPQAARVAPGLLEGAELRGVIRRDASRRDGETEVHVLERRPVAPRHRRELGGAPHRVEGRPFEHRGVGVQRDRKSTRLNSSHSQISYAVFCLKKKKNDKHILSNVAIFISPFIV